MAMLLLGLNVGLIIACIAVIGERKANGKVVRELLDEQNKMTQIIEELEEELPFPGDC